MSEYTCRNGHLIKGSGRCKKCGSRGMYEDGVSAKALERMARKESMEEDED